jgi:acetyl esterase/lipase
LIKALIWRGLMAIGVKFHHFAEPKTTIIILHCLYSLTTFQLSRNIQTRLLCPTSYFDPPDGYRFLVVVNFHGGGFTLGTGADNARWEHFVVENADAVLVSVAYLLAHEYPFSVGVEV